MSSCSRIEVLSGITSSSRPWRISAGCVSARMSASGTANASTQRCRGAGNIALKASWTPGRVAASSRSWARSSVSSDLSYAKTSMSSIMLGSDGSKPHTLSRPSVISKGTPAAPMRTSLSTRSGWCVAMLSASAPPKLLPTTATRSRPSASSSPTRCWVHVAMS